MLSKKIGTWVATAIISVTVFVSGTAHAEHTRVTNPSAIGLEILGRGPAYSIFFDRVLSDDLVAGLGYGTASMDNVSATAQMIPAYFNYYLARDQASLYLTGGVTVVANSGDVKGDKTSIAGLEIKDGVIPTVGLGYENRSDAGYLFRLAGYALIGGSVKPWVGLSFGYSF